MNIVHAVPADEIALVERKFRSNGWHLSADVWRMGVNLALRITDLLSLRFEQLQDGVLELKEGKTGKLRVIPLNNTARRIIEQRRQTHPDHAFVFQATGNRVKNLAPKPVSRQYVSRQFQQVGEELAIRFGTHSMRKTRGKALFDEGGHPIELISKMLNHRSPSITMSYIGIESDRIEQTYRDIEL